MNSNSAVATSAAAISGAMLGGVVAYLFTLMHIAPLPPVDVAGTIGALLVGGGHAATNWLNSRFPAVAAPAAPVAVPVALAPPVVVPAAVVVPARPPVAAPVAPASQPAAAPAAAPVGA